MVSMRVISIYFEGLGKHRVPGSTCLACSLFKGMLIFSGDKVVTVVGELGLPCLVLLFDSLWHKTEGRK